MQTNELMALIENLKSSDYGHIEVSHEGTTLVFDKNSCPPAPIMMAPTAPVASAPLTTPVASAEQETPQVAEAESVRVTTPVETTDLTDTVTIDSPIVGTFYDSASPEAEAYVKVGSQVKKGDVVCIIEAMKLMNEIEAEVDGEVVEVLVANEGPVEYNQPLFRIKPL